MSTNRTLVQFVATQPVSGPEATDPPLHGALLRLQPGELSVAVRERAEEASDEGAHGAALLGGADTRSAVDVVGNGDRDVLHSGYASTVSQMLCCTVS